MFKKLFGPNHGKISHQIKFSVLALVMLLVVAGLVVYLSTFLITQLNRGLQTQFTPAPAPKFDIAGFKKLNLGK